MGTILGIEVGGSLMKMETETERNQRVARQMATGVPILMGLILEMAMVVGQLVKEDLQEL